MPPFVIILILVIAPMVLGALLKMFKAYQEEVDRQNQRKKPRNSVPTVPVSSGSSSSAATGRGTGEIDRFLQEIDKLRQKADGPVKVAPVRTAPVKAVPVAKAAPRIEPPPFVTTAPLAPTRGGPITDVPVPRVTAPALPTLPSRPAPAGGTAAPRVTTRTSTIPVTSFGKNLADLLGNKQAIPLAIVLQEVLGPPKSRRA
jgi:hypothetical protein